MSFLGIMTLRDFIRKYDLSKKQETELITIQAFHQGVGMLIGAGAMLLILQVIAWVKSSGM